MRRAWLLTLVLAACGAQDVVVAFVPPGDGGMPPIGKACTVNTECKPMDYCDYLSCGDAQGHCRPRPPACPANFDPVCDCENQVTYLNDCYRSWNGVRASTPGQCSVGATCNASTPCPGPSSVSCSRLTPVCQPSPVDGLCWWVPPACPGVAAYSDCSGGTCRDLCSAIRSEQQHERLGTPTCP